MEQKAKEEREKYIYTYGDITLTLGDRDLTKWKPCRCECHIDPDMIHFTACCDNGWIEIGSLQDPDRKSDSQFTLSLEERIKKAYEHVEEMNNRDKTGLSFVDIMKPQQWLNNLLMWKAQMDAEEEVWKPVVSFEGLYEVSNKGEIKSLAKSWRSGHRNALRAAPEKILSPYKAGRGYLCVRLCKEAAKKSNYIHILVAKHFIENPNNLPEVNHIDGNKLNNNKTNLEWTTSSGNKKHAYNTGLKRFKGNRYVLRP